MRDSETRRGLEQPSEIGPAWIATAVHELRQPLNVARWAVSMLREAKDGATRERACQVMERQVHRMQRLVDELLELGTRTGAGALRVDRLRVDLVDLVRQAGEDVQAGLEQRGLRLSLEVPRAAVSAEIDPDKVQQMLSNLIDNAARYTDRGGEIRIAVEDAGDQTVLRVSDTGRGLDPDELSRILGPGRPAARGHGIGLAIVRTIVELHGGRLEARSAGRGRGAEFVVRLPRSAPTGSL